jgi:hypothetical protein
MESLGRPNSFFMGTSRFLQPPVTHSAVVSCFSCCRSPGSIIYFPSGWKRWIIPSAGGGMGARVMMHLFDWRENKWVWKSFVFCLRPDSEAVAEGLGRPIWPPCPPSPPSLPSRLYWIPGKVMNGIVWHEWHDLTWFDIIDKIWHE